MNRIVAARPGLARPGLARPDWRGPTTSISIDLLCYAAAENSGPAMITLYGIKNCDTVKKARRWLEQHDIEYRFHDFREEGLDEQRVRDWLAELGWETLVNRRSTSWKALPAEQRESMNDTSALAAILEQPTLVKRPLLDTGHERHTGFSPAGYAKIFNLHTL